MTYAACRARTNACKILVRKSSEKQPLHTHYLAKTDDVKKKNWVGSAAYPWEVFHVHNKEYFNQINNYSLLGEHIYFWTKAGFHLCIQVVHMTCNIEFMGISHTVSLIMSLSMTAAMCTTVTTGNFELMECSKIATGAVHGAWLRRWQGRMVQKVF